MKYKIGDKVRIKTWKEIKKEYIFEKGSFGEEIRIPTKNGKSPSQIYYTEKMEKELRKLNNNRILTISEYRYGLFYCIKEFQNSSIKNCVWSDDMIICLKKEYNKIYIPVKNRWEILDL